MSRQRLYTLLAVANAELQKSRAGFCDDDYRYILQQCGASEKNGRISAKTMTIPEMELAVSRLKQLGFKPKRQHGAGWRQPRIDKLNAMWCALADADVVRNRAESALENFCSKQVPTLSRLRWATSDQLNQCVEILKQWCLRTGVELE